MSLSGSAMEINPRPGKDARATQNSDMNRSRLDLELWLPLCHSPPLATFLTGISDLCQLLLVEWLLKAAKLS